MANPTEETIVLEWSYTPPHYFEGTVPTNRGLYELEIQDGRIKATFPATFYDNDPGIPEVIYRDVNDMFMGIQVVSHEPYNLSRYAIYRDYPDGRRDATIIPNTILNTSVLFPPDIQVRDADGNVVFDSKQDRIQEKLRVAELSSKYRKSNPVVASIFSSYDAAVDDPDNELVHLYEVRDALVHEFGNEKAVQSTLGITPADWSRFGRPANADPLRQGRHTGKNPGQLRDATAEELQEARRIVKQMILAYLEYLERTTGP
jgi:hypothetical protein